MAKLSTNMTRVELEAYLRKRDGDQCMFPGCERPLDDPSDINTIDHIYPQFLAAQDGWTRDQVDHLSNLQILHKSCNTIKGHQLPDENGQFLITRREPKPVKGPRPTICGTCYSGRILLIGEICSDCNSGPQPVSAPSAYQKTPKECSHSGHDHCWMCYLGFVERGSALQNIITGI
jgi:hypothetical protein